MGLASNRAWQSSHGLPPQRTISDDTGSSFSGLRLKSCGSVTGHYVKTASYLVWQGSHGYTEASYL